MAKTFAELKAAENRAKSAVIKSMVRNKEKVAKRAKKAAKVRVTKF